jgi:hypothetical protein
MNEWMNEWMNEPSIKQTIRSQVDWKVGVSSIMYKLSYMLSKFLCPISSVRGWMNVLRYNPTQLQLQWICNERTIHQQTIWWQVNCKIGFSSIMCKLSYRLSKILVPNFKCAWVDGCFTLQSNSTTIAMNCNERTIHQQTIWW